MDHLFLDDILTAQSSNSTLGGAELRNAALDLIRLVQRSGSRLLPCDAAGERIVGAALVLVSDLTPPADMTTRLEGVDCLLVSGRIAGPHQIAEVAAIAKRLGADSVTAAVLGGWEEMIEGIDELFDLHRSTRNAA